LETGEIMIVPKVWGHEFVAIPTPEQVYDLLRDTGLIIIQSVEGAQHG
jgi:hypothetical protein